LRAAIVPLQRGAVKPTEEGIPALSPHISSRSSGLLRAGARPLTALKNTWRRC